MSRSAESSIFYVSEEFYETLNRRRLRMFQLLGPKSLVASNNNLNVFENEKMGNFLVQNPEVSRQLRCVRTQRTYFPVGHKIISYEDVAAQAKA